MIESIKFCFFTLLYNVNIKRKSASGVTVSYYYVFTCIFNNCYSVNAYLYV